MTARPLPTALASEAAVEPLDVLVRLPNWVGDACMSLPALRALESANCRLHLLGRAWARPLFAGHAWGFADVGKGVGAAIAAVRQWKAKHPDGRALLLPNSLGSALAARWAGVPAAGFPTDGRGFLLRWRVPAPPPTHEVRRFHAAARGALLAWGRDCAPEPGPRLGLIVHPEHRLEAYQALGAQGIEPPYVVLAPLAVGLHHGRVKHWSGFGALGDWLATRGHRVVACPPAAEAEATRALLPEATLLPPMNLGVFAGVLAGAALVVANDSGASHVAAAVNAPQLTIHGVTDPARTGAWSDRAHVVGGPQGWPDFATVVDSVQRLLDGG